MEGHPLRSCAQGCARVQPGPGWGGPSACRLRVWLGERGGQERWACPAWPGTTSRYTMEPPRLERLASRNLLAISDHIICFSWDSQQFSQSRKLAWTPWNHLRSDKWSQKEVISLGEEAKCTRHMPRCTESFLPRVRTGGALFPAPQSSLRTTTTDSRQPQPSSAKFLLGSASRKSGHIGFLSNFQVLVVISNVISVAVQYQLQAELSVERDTGVSPSCGTVTALRFFKAIPGKRDRFHHHPRYTLTVKLGSSKSYLPLLHVIYSDICACVLKDWL